MGESALPDGIALQECVVWDVAVNCATDAWVPARGEECNLNARMMHVQMLAV
ncbi:hypothetical protein U128_02810 [Anaplasma marginale str. Gypsy Plains]|nr:hypothetical protein U128_02810 [Anaplasma marginale str. Gypsy Plains]